MLRDVLHPTSLADMLERAFGQQRKRATDITVSSHPFALVAGGPLTDPAHLAHYAPGANVFVLCPESSAADSYFVTLWRTHMGRLSSAGRSSRVVPRNVIDALQAMMERQGGPKAIERNRGDVEFLIRLGWRADEIMPDGFPKPLAAPATAGAVEAHRRHAELRRHRRRGRALPEMWHDNTLDPGRAD